GRINFESEEFKKSLKDFTKRVEKAAKDGEKIAKDISDKLTKKMQKVLEKENERLRKAVNISTEEYEEIVEEIEEARHEIDDAQQHMGDARDIVIGAQREIGAAKRRIERAIHEEDRELQHEAEEELMDATEELQDAKQEINNAKQELAQAKREFARLQRRAAKIHNAQSRNGGSRVIRAGDVDFGSTFTEYADRVMSSVAKNLESTIKTAVDGSKRAIRGVTRIERDGNNIAIEHEDAIDIEELDEVLEINAELLSALGDKRRLLILKILENSPQYQKELAEETGLRGGTFKHHTDILQDVNFITREAIRGRYLITQLGIEALKLSELIHSRKSQLEKYENEDDDSIDIDIED
ncbi:MAG: ArsR family transcriptional regulator, partial [Candidatus Heimdallarchaeota archaeon]|nr:ArsR family transcriptional regulator [Candidatus Heimdallarchaeota archaeon]